MDEQRIKKINQLLLKVENSNFFNRSKTINQLANEIIRDIGQDVFLIDINKKYSVIVSEDLYSSSGNDTKIQIATDIYRNKDIGALLYDLIHESAHKVQDQANKYLEKSNNEHIKALRINGLTTMINLNNKDIELPNYFDSPPGNNFGGYMYASVFCYKLQPREIQARYITFQVLDDLIKSSWIEDKFKEAISLTLKYMSEERPDMLKISAAQNCVGMDVQRETEKLLLCLDGKKGLSVDSRVIAVFLKSQEKYINEQDRELFREKFNFFARKDNDKVDVWKELQGLEDLRLEIESPESERERRVLETLLIYNEDEEIERDL